MESIVPQKYTTSFIRKEQLSKDAYIFYFDRRAVEFSFIPGQYIRLFLPITPTDGRGNGRFFSIITSPENSNEFAICTRIIQSEFKKALATLTPQSQVSFTGPYGRFVLEETNVSPRVFLAGGIGITPFHSMLLYAAEKNLAIPLTLFVSFSTAEEVIFYNELKVLEKKNSHINIVYTISHPDALPANWQGETGRISKEMITKYIKDVTKPIYFLAGPPPMVDAMGEIVGSFGLSSEQIKKENFTGY